MGFYENRTNDDFTDNYLMPSDFFRFLMTE